MARGLSTAELKSIRDTLASGRRPKVMFTESAGQIAGQTGQVIKLTDPEMSDEWVVVKFGNDELPFSPTDLSVPARSPKAAAAAAKRSEAGGRTEQASAAEPEFKVLREIPAARGSSGRSGGAADAAAAHNGHEPAATATSAGTSGAVTGNGTGAADTTVDGAQRDAAPAAAKPARRSAGRSGKGKALPGLTVTLAYADGEWTVAANQGSKALAKPYLIKPADALKMVALLDVPGVHEAVAQIVSAERAEAEAQAQRLRDQLAQIEERLAELREAN